MGKIYPNKKEMNNLLETCWGTLLYYVQVIHVSEARDIRRLKSKERIKRQMQLDILNGCLQFKCTIQYFWDNLKNKKWKQNKWSMESWSSILFIVICSV